MNISRTNTLALATLLIAALGASACEKKEKSATPEAQEPAPSTAAPANPAVQPTQAPADPGKLKTIMAGIADEMTLAQLGLWTENFNLISESAIKIAEHAKVSDTERTRVMTALGEDMPAFVAMDKVVHDSAMRLSEAAKSSDLPATLKELTGLQSACVSCHSTFRARLVK